MLITLAVNKLGAVWVPVSTDYRGEWLRDTLERSRCGILFTDDERASELEKLGGDYGTPVLVGDGPQAWQRYADLAATDPLPAAVEQDYGATCAILWTSGTTGKSKGVMQNYNAWIRAISQGASPMFDSRPGDVIYCALPLFNTRSQISFS